MDEMERGTPKNVSVVMEGEDGGDLGGKEGGAELVGVGEEDDNFGMVLQRSEDGGEVHEEWLVEKILKSKLEEGKTLCRIKWVGWESKYNTWEPLEHLTNCRDKVDAFERKKLRVRKTPSVITTPRGPREESPPPPQQPEEITPSPPKLTPEDAPFRPPNLDQFLTPVTSRPSYLEGRSPPRRGELTPKKRLSPRTPPLPKLTPKKPRPSKFLPKKDTKEETAFQRKVFGLNFNRTFPPGKIPLCILGSIRRHSQFFHLVRLRPENCSEGAIVREAPFSNINSTNTIVVPSTTFHRSYPQILINYYQKLLQLN